MTLFFLKDLAGRIINFGFRICGAMKFLPLMNKVSVLVWLKLPADLPACAFFQMESW